MLQGMQPAKAVQGRQPAQADSQTAAQRHQAVLDLFEAWQHQGPQFSGYQDLATPCARQQMTPSPQASNASQQSNTSQQSQYPDQPFQEPGSHSSYAQVTKHLLAQRATAGTPMAGQPANNLDVINQQMACMSVNKPAVPATPAAAQSPYHDLIARDQELARPYSLFTTPKGLKHTIFSSQPSWRSQQPPCQAISFDEPSPAGVTFLVCV